MAEVPFVISASFSKTVQTAPYESEKAEISAQCQVSEGVDAVVAIEGTMSMVKRQVLIALGKEVGELKAVSTDPQKRGPGRPPKVKDAAAEQEKTADKAAPQAETPKEEPKIEDDDFGDPEDKPIEAISDKELQDACGAAAKIITAPTVKDLFQRKYGAQRVSLVKPEERKAFLMDLEGLVSAKKAEGK